MARGTLVVVTSRQLLEVWRSEINSHFRTGVLSVAIFHGEQRAKAPQEICNHDVVLTTYSTLMADSSPTGRHTLQKISWFRVVLDEAHWIRNTSTKQYTAAVSLSAERRWCVSGTPIQNSMEDLLSMLKFLRFSPFSTPSVFEKYIISPLRSDSPDAFQNLKFLLRAICLRRNSSLLNLEHAISEMISVPLTAQERGMYKEIQSRSREEFDRITSQKSEVKRSSVLFTTILKLRRLCSHGPVAQLLAGQPSPSKTKGKAKNVISSYFERTCEYCRPGDEDMSRLLQDVETCPECSRPLNLKDSQTSMGLDSDSAGDISPSPMYLGPDLCSTTTLSRSPSPLNPRSLSSVQYGESSKITAIADNIQQHVGDSKSLVFSSWRDTLDNLARSLHERGISYIQIDGRVSPADRETRLAKFQQDPAVLVLLISIQTGAVGLTLTCANRVHLAEPQWNPAVEEQAIARVLRMGQKQRVTVVRYVTEYSVEENILALQKKKSRLAKLSLDATGSSSEPGGMDDLKFMLDPDAI
ncbi:hypothetical protein VMCG_04012 [Cytospora schulzeri]|uniref:Helicase ATP-binding domain-containing protein n=1 Tax=Cytospora schulzeri TaxID=448051 RepID=A0A423WTB2_9PEZI|nr:hypothetical protein VMCG_04012 [Valsa malicola]